MSKHLLECQLGIFFSIGNLPFSTVESADLSKSYEIIDKAVVGIRRDTKDVPGSTLRHDNNGFVTNDPSGMMITHVEMCEFDGELTEIDGLICQSIWFISSNEIQPELCQGLRDLCMKEMLAVAGDEPIKYAGAEMARTFQETIREPISLVYLK